MDSSADSKPKLSKVFHSANLAVRRSMFLANHGNRRNEEVALVLGAGGIQQEIVLLETLFARRMNSEPGFTGNPERSRCSRRTDRCEEIDGITVEPCRVVSRWQSSAEPNESIDGPRSRRKSRGGG